MLLDFTIQRHVFSLAEDDSPPISSLNSVARPAPSGASAWVVTGMALFLITGIAGFIGSSLARELVGRGQSVRGIDNFSTGRPETIDSLRSRIEFEEMDLTDRQQLDKMCVGVDVVLHEAGIPSVSRSIADPIASNLSNVDGTLNLLMAARSAKVKRVVYASSYTVYGSTDARPQSEHQIPRPQSPYAASKLAGEHYMSVFAHTYGLETVSLRYFNVFGPHQSPSAGVLANFIVAMLEQKAPTIYGSGEQARDFTFIDDIVHGTILACFAPNITGASINIATGRAVTLNYVYEVLQKLTGFSGVPRYEAPGSCDVRYAAADIAKAQAHLHYRPSVALEDGLSRTVNWYRERSRMNVATNLPKT